MPTAYYKVMTERDLDAVVAYLRTIPPLKNQVPTPIYKIALQPPVVPSAQMPMSEADLDDQLKRGFYLVTIGHCMECHSPMGPTQGTVGRVHLAQYHLGQGQRSWKLD